MKPKRRHVLITAALAVAAAVVGLGVFAVAGGLDRTVTERVHGGGTRVVRVALVDAVVGFDVTPDRLVVDSGTHLVLEVVNEGDEIHDLALEGGARTKSLDPGQSQRLDLGVITSDLPELYCTLPGHRLAGMTLEVQIQEAPQRSRPRIARPELTRTEPGTDTLPENPQIRR
jgi:nitrite reductase (NO-forming)